VQAFNDAAPADLFRLFMGSKVQNPIVPVE
jgi:hypothetical protein